MYGEIGRNLKYNPFQRRLIRKEVVGLGVSRDATSTKQKQNGEMIQLCIKIQENVHQTKQAS